MHVVLDLNWLLQFTVPVVAAAFGFLYLVRNAASRFFVVDSNYGSTSGDFSPDRKSTGGMGAAVGEVAEVSDSCVVCGRITKKHCAGCKMVKYCSEVCQRSHWNSEHKTKCKDLQSNYKAKNAKSTSLLKKKKASLVPAGGSSKILKQSNKILFPYEEFLKYFNWDKPGYPPCGLLNCGNSCFANVVLQCLAYTRPLVAYLLEKGHKTECQMEDWCFLCEFQSHVERASQSISPFSPINILSRLRNIGGNLGYGKQEDAHEFMRLAIDTMQSVCLDEFGGEKAVHPSYQETTLIQHIFGGRLQSRVICTQCNNVSDQFENMMDLTVEIHGDAGSLEECLDQFTAKEWLHGDNKYKCDSCNAYVMAWKRLTVHRAPNILTIALKRFQSGRFGKLNKRVTFPETLNLSSYMSEFGDGNDIYNLYAVIVHVDMQNASYFGHYICYIKDFCGNWYRIDDCKVARVELDNVLPQGAYMLLYSRICARPSCLLPAELLKKPGSEDVKVQSTECLSAAERVNTSVETVDSSSANCSEIEVNYEEELTSTSTTESAREDVNVVSSEASLPIISDEPYNEKGLSISAAKEVASPVKDANQPTPASTSLIDKSFIQPEDAHTYGPIPLISGIEIESCGNKRGTNECLISRDRIGEAQEENSAKMSSGKSRGAKLKPVFAPGFLGKHPRKALIKQEDNAIPKLSEASKLPQKNQTNDVVEPYLSPGKGCLLKDDEKTCLVLENGNISTESAARRIVLENGNISTESAARRIRENGDSCHELTSCETVKTNTADEMLQVKFESSNSLRTI